MKIHFRTIFQSTTELIQGFLVNSLSHDFLHSTFLFFSQFKSDFIFLKLKNPLFLHLGGCNSVIWIIWLIRSATWCAIVLYFFLSSELQYWVASISVYCRNVFNFLKSCGELCSSNSDWSVIFFKAHISYIPKQHSRYCT